MVSTSVVATKLFIPQVRPRRVLRTRLIDILNEGVKHKLTIVSAPAGYGKTTLLSEWANQSPIPVAWISLDEADNDEDRLLTYLVAAIQAISDGSGMGEIVLAIRQSPQPLPLQTVMAAMINEMADYGHEFALVFDDYHAIDNQSVHDLVALLLNYLPANVHLVISSRAVPPLPLARLRARDELTELTASDLKFVGEEAEIFLSDVMGLTLSAKDLQELESRTEGWVASLQLAALSLKGRDDPGKVISQLTGAHRFILDYLAQEVLGDQQKRLQEFLLKTSILENLSASLCDEVLGIENSQQYLELLEAENLFITALDPERRWYRYHRLFRDFLVERQAQIQPDHSELHLRAAQWYEKEGNTAEAVDHYLSASAHNRAADVIEGAVVELISRGEITTVARWTGDLPEEEIRNRPRLVLAREWALLIRNPLLFWSTTEERMERLAESLDTSPISLIERLEDNSLTMERRNVLCEFAIMLAFVARQAGDLDGSISLFEAGVRGLADDALIMKALGKAGLGSVYGRLGAFRQAERAFGEAVKISQLEGSIFFVVICSGFQGLMKVLQGGLEEAKLTYQRGIDLLTENLGPSAPLSGQVYAGLGDIFREQNDLKVALEYITKGIDRGESVRDFDALRDGYVTLARVRYSLGDSEGSQEAIEFAKRVVAETNSRECMNEVACWEARLALMEGNRKLAKNWAENRGFPEVAVDDYCGDSRVINESTTYARLLIAERKSAQALKLLDGIQRDLENTERKHELIEILTLRALCLQAAGRRDDAMRALGQALLLGEPEGYARMFLNEGPAMAALLRNAGSQGHSPEYVNRLLVAFGAEVASGGSIDPLSERELQVLTLMGEGFTNKEIAEELVIGISTVKTHVNRIYSKMNVSNRTQAVIKSREKGLV